MEDDEWGSLSHSLCVCVFCFVCFKVKRFWRNEKVKTTTAMEVFPNRYLVCNGPQRSENSNDPLVTRGLFWAKARLCNPVWAVWASFALYKRAL